MKKSVSCLLVVAVLAAGHFQCSDGSGNEKCKTDADCDDGLFCSGEETCEETGCIHSGDPCAGSGLICDEAGDRCVECLEDQDCQDDGIFCNGLEICNLDFECQPGGDPCLEAGQLCDEAGDRCVDCLEDGDCRDELFCNGDEFCDSASGTCAVLEVPCFGLGCREEDDSCEGSFWGGGISANQGMSDEPSLALDATGYPVVAWHDDSSGDLEIYVKRYDGAAWVEMGEQSSSDGGISSDDFSSGFPALATDGTARPVVVWHNDTRGSFEIFLKRFEVDAWVGMAGSASGGGISNNGGESFHPSLALDDDGSPVVAWSDSSTGRREIYVKRYYPSGGNWGEVGEGSTTDGISANGSMSLDPSVALDSDGNPVVAWHDAGSGAYEIYVKRYDGSGWVEIPAGSASGGGVSASGDGSYNASLAVDGDGNPVVAWDDDSSGNSEIFVRRYDPNVAGGSWVEVGVGSASGGGISNNAGYSDRPALALDDQGNPVVAWQDDRSGNYEIYVLRFDGDTWLEVGAGSASGGGISDNSGRSGSPSLALDASGNPVIAWSDETTGNREIYIKRFNGTEWVGIPDL